MIPRPSPIIIPSDSASKGLISFFFEKAGVLLKLMYMKMELSVSTPPVSIISVRPEVSSPTAIWSALSELAQAASTTQFTPPRSSLFATRPEMTLPNMPGKEFSSHGM